MDLATQYKVLAIFKRHISPELDINCLEYFANSKLTDVVAVELEQLYMTRPKNSTLISMEAKWMDVLINIHVSCPHDNFDSIDIVLNEWEEGLEKSNKYIVRQIVSRLSIHDVEDDLILWENARDKRLYDLILRSFNCDDGLLINDLLKLCIMSHNLSAEVWNKLLSVKSSHIEYFLTFTLSEYHVCYLVSDEDTDGLMNLSKTHFELKEEIANILSKLYTTKSIKALHEIGLTLTKERASDILLAGLKYDYSNKTVISAYDYLKTATPDTFEELLISIYNYRNKNIDEKAFCDSIPKTSGCRYSRPRLNILIEILKSLLESVEKNSKVKLRTAIKRYEDERRQ